MLDLNELTLRLGRVGKALRSVALARAAIGTDANRLAAEYDALRDVAAPVTSAVASAKQQAGGMVPALTQCARDTVLRAVRADQSARSWTYEEAVAEVVRQFAAQGDTVPECVTGLTPTALSPFAGDGLLITTIKGGGSEVLAGALLENLFAETLWLTCVADAQSGGTARGREQFRLRGGVAQADVWMDDWPAGSGADLTLSAADPGTDASSTASGNQLTNSGFDAFTSSAPDSWTIQSGTAGTQIDDTTADQYTGAAALALPGNATLAALYQTFGTDTDGAVLPLARYAVAVRLKASAAPATGALVLELVDDSSTVINDPQGNPLRLTIALTALTTSYSARSTVWVTPRALPTTVRFRVRVSTAIEIGRTVFLDSLCLVPMAEPYPGGPAVAVVSGRTPFVLGDGWTIDVTNDRAGSDYGSTWQALFDRLFSARSLGLQLPSSAIGWTYGDELITD